jgi:hypothetical protein
LRERLATAPPAYLTGAVDNPALTEDGMELLLRNRAASEGLLARIGRDRRWTRHLKVRRALVRHLRTPYSVARGLVSQLYWRDLADLVEDIRFHPALRRQAEQLLSDRLPALAVGERVTLARKASPGLIPALAGSGETPVFRALLDNARLRSADAERIAGGENVRGEILRLLAEHPTWGRSRDVLLALARNPRTPVAVALKVLARLSRDDLERLSEDDAVPQIVRVGSRRRMETSSGRDRSPGDENDDHEHFG